MKNKRHDINWLRDKNKTICFDPPVHLKANTEYYIHVDRTIRDEFGVVVGKWCYPDEGMRTE